MAKYVEYTPEVKAEVDGPGVHVWWFPTTFSQSQLGDRIIGSNACTLIAVLLAGKINEFKITIWGYQDQPLSRMLVTSLAESIVDGNEIHEKLMHEGTVLNMDLTVPEALRATKQKYPNLVEWGDKTTLILESLRDTLTDTLKPVIQAFEHDPPDGKLGNTSLYAVLVADGRSVLFVYQPETSKVTMIDSHAHSRCLAGSVVAQSSFGNIDQLCIWFCAMLDQAFARGSNVRPYELTFLYLKESVSEGNNNSGKK